MDNKEYIKKLKKKRKTKITKILEYFDKYYPNIKLQFQMGKTIKVKHQGKLLETFNTAKTTGVKLEGLHRTNSNHIFIILKRFGVTYKRNSYQQVIIPKYFFVIRNIERELIKNGILRTSPKLKRKSYE